MTTHNWVSTFATLYVASQEQLLKLDLNEREIFLKILNSPVARHILSKPPS
jgi:hypothetical protein